ncbi:MAG: hypothetical protein JW733_04755 [Coriobacteriia bacterium]|nr:hypothetical protein [Coriobacteriia bacterium]MBN2847425.1 hypothetical protein [Coriobacteriia bacterium]
MKKVIAIALLALVLALGSTASAFAASSANYSIIVPRFQADKYTTAKAVYAYRDFGVRHKYSGGKPIRFAVCNTSRQQIGSTVTIYPGGTYAPLTDLWYNATASTRYILVRMDSATFNTVEILCAGTWVWNY